MKQISLIIKQILEEQERTLQVEKQVHSEFVEGTTSIDIPDFMTFDSFDENVETNEINKRRLAVLGEDLDYFNKVVILLGTFSSGKTSLINLITGLDLPTDSMENTKLIVECAYSREKRLVLYFDDGRIQNKKYNHRLVKDLISKKPEEVEKKITEKELVKIRIWYPLKNINQKVLIVDTPGINGLSFEGLLEKNTLPYLRQIPRQKIKIVWLQSLERAQPSQEEIKIINQLISLGKSKVFIGTKYDQFSTMGHWDDLIRIYGAPIFHTPDEEKKSIGEIFHDNIYAARLKPDVFVRNYKTKESYTQISKDLIEEWFGNEISEVKSLYNSIVNNNLQRFRSRKDQILSELSDDIMPGIKESYLNDIAISTATFSDVYEMLKASIVYNEENDQVVDADKLNLSSSMLNQLVEKINFSIILFMEKCIISEKKRIQSIVHSAGIDIAAELTFFEFVNSISCRLFIKDSKKLLQSKIKKQFSLMNRHYVNLDKISFKEVKKVRDEFFSPNQFIFFLSWFETHYKHNYEVLLRLIQKKIFKKALE